MIYFFPDEVVIFSPSGEQFNYQSEQIVSLHRTQTRGMPFLNGSPRKVSSRVLPVLTSFASGPPNLNPDLEQEISQLFCFPGCIHQRTTPARKTIAIPGLLYIQYKVEYISEFRTIRLITDFALCNSAEMSISRHIWRRISGWDELGAPRRGTREEDAEPRMARQGESG